MKPRLRPYGGRVGWWVCASPLLPMYEYLDRTPSLAYEGWRKSIETGNRSFVIHPRPRKKRA